MLQRDKYKMDGRSSTPRKLSADVVPNRKSEKYIEMAPDQAHVQTHPQTVGKEVEDNISEA